MLRKRLGIGHVSLALAGTVGLLMLVPSGDGTVDAEPTATTARTALTTSSELKRFLDNAVDPTPAAKTPQQVVAEISAEPEPFAPAVAAVPAALPPVERQDREMTTARSAVNMRAGPSTDHATLFVLQPDEQVAVLEKDGNWIKVEKTSGATGWVYSRYLGIGPEPEVGQAERPRPKADRAVREASVEPEPRKKEKRVQVSNSIKLRAGPSAGSEALLAVDPGTPLRVADRRGKWVRVVLPSGVSGWLRTR